MAQVISDSLTLKEREMVERIVQQFHPQQVVLFGSHARGTADASSDIDLLVVLPMRGSRRAKRLQMQRAIFDLGISTDTLRVVATPREIRRQRAVVGTLARTALNEGKVLYARS